MPKQEKYYDPDRARVAERAADAFIEAINSKEGDCHIALCGGRSAKEFYRKIAEKASAVKDLNRLHIWLVDERFNTEKGDYDPSDRNTAVIEENLVNDLKSEYGFLPENFHRLPAGSDVDKVTRAYERDFRENVPDGKFDLSVLGSGKDGHVAGIFPGKAAIDSREEGFAFETDSPKYPPLRITALPATIRKSGQIFLFMMGEGKRGALEGFEGKENIAYQATRGGKVRVFTDIKID